MTRSYFTVRFWLRRVWDLFAVLGVLATLAGGYAVYRRGIPSPWLLKKKVSTLASRATKGSFV